MRDSEPNTARVYGLIDPATHRVMYVGRSRALLARYAEHCRGACKSTQAWVGSLTARPVLVVLETVHGTGSEIERLGNDCETKWIKRFRKSVINKLLRDNCPDTWDRLINH
jgi:hypothetical protein